MARAEIQQTVQRQQPADLRLRTFQTTFKYLLQEKRKEAVSRKGKQGTCCANEGEFVLFVYLELDQVE